MDVRLTLAWNVCVTLWAYGRLTDLTFRTLECSGRSAWVLQIKASVECVGVVLKQYGQPACVMFVCVTRGLL